MLIFQKELTPLNRIKSDQRDFVTKISLRAAADPKYEAKPARFAAACRLLDFRRWGFQSEHTRRRRAHPADAHERLETKKRFLQTNDDAVTIA